MSSSRIEWLCHRAASIQINTGADSPPPQVERWGPTSGNPWNPVAATPREDKNQWPLPMIPYFLTLKIHRKTCLALRKRKDWPWLHQTPCDVSIRVPPLCTELYPSGILCLLQTNRSYGDDTVVIHLTRPVCQCMRSPLSSLHQLCSTFCSIKHGTQSVSSFGDHWHRNENPTSFFLEI